MVASRAALVAAVAVLLVGCFALGNAKKLNDNIQHFEGLSIDSSSIMRKGRYTRDLYRHTTSFSFKLNAFDEDFHFDVKPQLDLFTSTVEFTVFDGEDREEIFLDDRSFYKGKVNADPESHCHFRVHNDGTLHGYFHHGEEKYQIDPAHFHDLEAEDADAYNHVIYRLSDHANNDIDLPSHCGVQKLEDLPEEEGTRSRRAAFDMTRTVCDVAYIADSLWYSTIGSSDISRTIDLMTARFDSVQHLYETSNTINEPSSGVQVTIRIGYFEIQTNTGSDPYNPSSFGGDGEAYLRHVSTDPNSATSGVEFQDFCVVHILTQQDFDGGLLGLAWVGSTGGSPGGICQARANLGGNLLTTNTGFSTQINFGSDVPTLTAYLVMSHEIGHNFGSGHDADSGSSNGQFLMFPVSVTGEDSNNFLFSSTSLTTMGAVVSAKGGCFIASTDPSCGNGVQEGSEECDCGNGDPTLCAGIDSCCSSDCMLAMGAACSPRHSENGACCNSDCTLITSGECRAATECTLASSCDAMGTCPTPANRADFTSCTSTNSMLCMSGECSSSVCSAWGLTEDTSMIGTCVIFCGPEGSSSATADLGAPMTSILDTSGMTIATAGTNFTRAPGESCRFSASEAGVCNDMAECVEADTTIFDNIIDFLNSIDLDAIKEWFLRTDYYIPNYGWVAIGAGLLILLISLCCCISNKMDKQIT